MPSDAASPGFQSLGQHVARRAVLEAVHTARLGRTLLVHGPQGAGKGAFVDDLLALLFCVEPDVSARPCNRCRGCAEGRSRVHPDLVIGSPLQWRETRATGESTVAAARRWLLGTAGAPIVAARRVVLVEQIDRANEQAQNALLKALEEPAPRHIFILVADDAARLLPTIRSRAQPLRVGPVVRAELAAWLQDRERLPADQAEALAAISHGMAGVAIGYARDPAVIAWRRRVQGELAGLLEQGASARFTSVRELLDEAARAAPAGMPGAALEADGDEPVRGPTSALRDGALRLIEVWISLARDLLLAGRSDPPAAGALVDDLPALARRIEATALAACIRVLAEVQDGLRQNAAPRLALEVAMLAWPRLPRASSPRPELVAAR